MEEVIICVALCLFMNGELVEHTYQKSMGDCLKGEARRDAYDRARAHSI